MSTNYLINEFRKRAETSIQLYEGIAKDKALEAVVGKPSSREANEAEARAYMLRVTVWREALAEFEKLIKN